jgi:hypothetical protein
MFTGTYCTVLTWKKFVFCKKYGEGSDVTVKILLEKAMVTVGDAC